MQSPRGTITGYVQVYLHANSYVFGKTVQLWANDTILVMVFACA